MKVAALFSGGKDSVFSIYITKQFGWEIKELITVKPERKDSWMFHSLNIDITKILAEALKIPLFMIKTQGIKEKEIEDLKNFLKKFEIDGVISGAIASEYQRTRIERICHEIGLKSFTPIWHKNQELLLRNMINSGFEIMIVGVFAEGFNNKWLGKIIDEKTINDLYKIKNKYGINLSGEGGEFETLTINGPIFYKKLKIEKYVKEWKRDSGILKIEKFYLEEKLINHII
jgi:ABC transporter with metal-binding/Fe-S-binding domain ATP-binding protein